MAVIEGTVTVTTPGVVCNNNGVAYTLVDCDTGKTIATLAPGLTTVEITGEFCVNYVVEDCVETPEPPEFTVYPLGDGSTAALESIIECLEELKAQGEAQLKKPDIEKVTYCNTETNTQWLKLCTFVFDENGELAENIVSDTDLGVPCVEPTPDIEEVELCIDGTIQVQFYRFITDPDGTVQQDLLETLDTGVPCAEGQEECCGEVCTEKGTAIRVMERGPDGVFTGNIRFLHGVTGEELDPESIIDCPVTQTIEQNYCVET